MKCYSLQVESVGVVCSERSRVPQFDSTAARAPGDNGRSSREPKLLKSVLFWGAHARRARVTWTKVGSSWRLVLLLASGFRRHCLPVWKRHVVRRLRASLYGILRSGAAESCREGFRDRSGGRAHDAATPVRGALDDGGSPVRSRGPVLQWPLQLARKVRMRE